MDIVSIEFVILADLDGTSGANRNLPRNHCGAQNDRQVIEFWLADYEDPRTREKYRSEAEWLLLWAILSKGKTLSSLDINAGEYINRVVLDPHRARCG